MVVVMIESLGMFLALGEICDRHLDKEDLTRGLRVTAGTLIGGILNTFPHSSFHRMSDCWRHRRTQPLGYRCRRCYPDHSWPDPETGSDCRIGAALRPWRGGSGHVSWSLRPESEFCRSHLEEKPNNLLVVAVSIGFG